MLEGEKVRLRAVQRTDLAAFYRYVNDPEITKFLLVDPPLSWEQEEAWYDSLVKDRDIVYTIETIEGKVIGNIALLELNWKDRNAVLGIMIGDHDHLGKGYGTDAIRTMLRYAFETLNLERVGLTARKDNARAIGCYRKCGFQIEGLMRHTRHKNGSYHDHLVMSILKGEWFQMKGETKHREPY